MAINQQNITLPENILNKVEKKIVPQEDHKMFFLMAGPCLIEGEEMAFKIAEKIKTIADKLHIPFIFKGSYRKANRSSLNSYTGIGDTEALEILNKIGKKLKVPVITDIHESREAEIAAKYVDILQIPAFLCRQTDLLIAAAKTGKCINIKKGQFLNGSSMIHAIDKIKKAGYTNNIILTERGNSFGYTDLVVDYRNIPIMQGFKVPVVMDCTHSLQQPNQSNGVTGGDPNMIETIAKAAIAVGANGLFIETHPEPNKAKSDGANMLRLDKLDDLLEKLVCIRKAIIT